MLVLMFGRAGKKKKKKTVQSEVGLVVGVIQFMVRLVLFCAQHRTPAKKKKQGHALGQLQRHVLGFGASINYSSG